MADYHEALLLQLGLVPPFDGQPVGMEEPNIPAAGNERGGFSANGIVYNIGADHLIEYEALIKANTIHVILGVQDELLGIGCGAHQHQLDSLACSC